MYVEPLLAAGFSYASLSYRRPNYINPLQNHLLKIPLQV